MENTRVCSCGVSRRSSILGHQHHICYDNNNNTDAGVTVVEPC